MKLDHLMIEVTRQCNMTCEHCMRGPAENLTMSKEIMINFLADIKKINVVGFTGGEPTLPSGIKVIKQFMRICKTFKIDVNSFFIITNGKSWRKEIPQTVSSLLKFCKTNTNSIIEISRDQYHDPIAEKRKQFFLNMKSEFGKVKDTPFVVNRAHTIDQVCDQGNATSNSIGTFAYSAPSIMFTKGGFLKGTVYLNCVGNVVWGCDWSYESQNEPQNIICSANDHFERKFNEFQANREDWSDGPV